MDPAEIKRLAAEVSVQHGIRIDPDDPIMAVVTLNRLVLEDAFGRATDSIEKATQEFNRATERVQIRAGSVVASEVRECVAAIRAEIQKDIDGARLKALELVGEMHRSDWRSSRCRWIAVGLLAATALFIAGMCAGLLMARPDLAFHTARPSLESSWRNRSSVSMDVKHWRSVFNDDQVLPAHPIPRWKRRTPASSRQLRNNVGRSEG